MHFDAQGRPLSRREQIGLLAVFVAAFVARSLDFERVLLPDGEVVFAVGDAFYHARRALYSFLEFPDLLRFDPCINYPDGARIPHPPLLDWTTVGVARLFGSDVATFERVAAWVPVFLASLSVFPIVALGRWVASVRVGLIAAALYALIPICINYGQLGNFDHHALAGLLGSCLVLCFTRVLQLAAGRPGDLATVMMLLALLRAAMMLTWTGSLLYLLPGDAVLIWVASSIGNARLSRALGLSALASTLLILPIVAWMGDGAAGPFAAVELSRLHVLLYGCYAVLCLANGTLAKHYPRSDSTGGLVRLVLLAVPVAGIALMLPGVFTGLQTGLQFLGASDGYTETVVEQLPIFWGEGAYSLSVAHARMGALVYLLPLVPLAFFRLARSSKQDFVGWFLAGWTLLFGYLAFGQVRYAYDFAPAGCVGFALILFEVAGRIEAHGFFAGRQSVIVTILASALLAPTISGFYAPLVGLAMHGIRGDLDEIDTALLSIPGSQMRFAKLVAEATDDEGRCTPGALTRPAYGIVAHIALGHALHYSGQRATPADPFGPYIGQENFDALMRFMDSNHERRAEHLMETLSARYVATAADSLPRHKTSMLVRLHEYDGGFHEGIPQLGRFRLLTEGPVGVIGMLSMFGDDEEHFAPYKLFEFVPGAVIELQSEPARQMTVELPLETPAGRRFRWRGAARANDAGRIRIRVPYANPVELRSAHLTGRVESLGPYKVRVDERRFMVNVTEQQVRDGDTVYARKFDVRRFETKARGANQVSPARR